MFAKDIIEIIPRAYGANLWLQFWDSITKEDLEFSVGVKQNTWEVKELLPEEDRRTTVYQDNASDYAGSMYHHRQSTYNY